ncbi:hypothetical protein [Streptomyces sp. NPDC058418]|uniref:hypothetical protein n=1 Tax=Streptomyces sp. NPDC058418 TaxID=3346488 RepID=UPI003654D10B
MRTRTAFTAGSALLIATLVGCSSTPEFSTPAVTAQPSSSSSEAPSEPAKAEQDQAAADLEKAVRAYSDAYFKPDTKAAYGMMSARCKSETTEAVYGAFVEVAAKDYGVQEIRTLTVDQISGDLARVSYTYAVPKLDQKQQPWAREGGVWRYDAC